MPRWPLPCRPRPCAGPNSIPSDASTAKLEFCFALPGSSPAARLRVVASLARQEEGDAWAVASYDVHSEKWVVLLQGGQM